MTEQQKIVPFLFEGEHMLRMIEREGEPWFVVADICAILEIQNPTQSVGVLDDDERAMFNIGRQGGANCVSEGGLYTLILRSRDAITLGTPAHRFRRWVTAEVLPSIRKTGRYTDPAAAAIEEGQTDAEKLRKVNAAFRCFGRRAGAQMWFDVGLPRVPAMYAAFDQGEMFDGGASGESGSVH